jgi:hypothetical protein
MYASSASWAKQAGELGSERSADMGMLPWRNSFGAGKVILGRWHRKDHRVALE